MSLYLFFIFYLLKKITLVKNELKKYLPVSNLSFISKNWRKWSHLAYFPTWKQILCLIICNQYTKKRSKTMEKGRVTALTLLVLSAAFDTIDHLTLINRLSSWYGISGTTLDWFTSYLSSKIYSLYYYLTMTHFLKHSLQIWDSFLLVILTSNDKSLRLAKYASITTVTFDVLGSTLAQKLQNLLHVLQLLVILTITILFCTIFLIGTLKYCSGYKFVWHV